MDSECNVNFGIGWESAIEFPSRPIEDFAREITGLVPELDQMKHDQESGMLDLYQVQGKAKIRHVQVKGNSLQSAAGWELEQEEQASFVGNVAKAAEKLQLSMFDVKLVDLRHIYQVRHWGNHNDLIAATLLTQSAFNLALADIDGDLTALRLGFLKEPAGRQDLSIAIDLQPATGLGEIHSGDFDGDQISIVCGIARTGGFLRVPSFSEVLQDLDKVWHANMQDAIIKHVVEPMCRLAVPAKPEDQG